VKSKKRQVKIKGGYESIMKKITAAMLCFCMAAGVFAGCNNSGKQKVDATRTQLYVNNFNGGYGDRWLQKAKERFEEAYKDEHFEPGVIVKGVEKQGVQVIIENDKDKVKGPDLINTLSASQFEVFFTEGVNYNEYLAKDILMDITDIMDDELPGETKSIADKLNDTQKAYLNRGGKYYGIPHYQSYQGIIFDWDLFNEKGLFIKAGGGYTNANGNLAPGPSGIPNGYDAGLPATYDDFFALCEYMNTQRGITPISWSGEHISTYTSYLLGAAYADYQGKDGYELLTNAGTVPGKNTTKIVTGFDGEDNPILSEEKAVSISDPDSVKNLKKQAGWYHSLRFLDEIIKNNWYSKKSVSATQKHVMAQADFLYSLFEVNTTPIAMLLEGIWCQDEAESVFRDMEAVYHDEAKKSVRKFGLMPIPKVSAAEIGKPTLVEGNMAMSFINGNITNPVKKDLAKLFLKFMATDVSLREFTSLTGGPKDFIYDMGGDYGSLSHFSKSIYEISANANIAYPYYPNGTLQTQINAAAPRLREWWSNAGGGPLKNVPANAFIYDNISAKDYFLGLQP